MATNGVGHKDAATLTPNCYEKAREAFAYFDANAPGGKLAFCENAGGSQVPRVVADAVRDHLLYDCAQLDAGYALSERSTAAVHAARRDVAAFLGAHDGSGTVALGPSTSQLLANLGACYARVLGRGDEIVVHEACHEANAGPWVRCAAASGAALRWWRVDATPAFTPAAEGSEDAQLRIALPCASSLAALEGLLSERTRVVAVAHVSNLLGGVLDLRKVVALVRRLAPNARVVADGVAFAPHRLCDVAVWGVDWYAYSLYKTWGPHMAALYGSKAAFDELIAGCRSSGASVGNGIGSSGGAGVSTGPNHYFVPESDPAYWFELGGPSHEACAGARAVGHYLRRLAGLVQGHAAAKSTDAPAEAATDGEGAPACPPLARADVEAALTAAEAMEAPLAGPLLALLAEHPNVILVGPGAAPASENADSGWVERVPTISFVHRHKASADVARALQEKGFALRNGHNYAHRLVSALAPAVAPFVERDDGCAPGGGAASSSPEAALAALIEDGVVRVSLLHYNTPDEVEGLCAALREVL